MISATGSDPSQSHSASTGAWYANANPGSTGLSEPHSGNWRGPLWGTPRCRLGRRWGRCLAMHTAQDMAHGMAGGRPGGFHVGGFPARNPVSPRKGNEPSDPELGRELRQTHSKLSGRYNESSIEGQVLAAVVDASEGNTGLRNRRRRSRRDGAKTNNRGISADLCGRRIASFPLRSSSECLPAEQPAA